MMVTKHAERRSTVRVLRSVPEAEGYIAKVCFKTGPPLLTGVELEWITHHDDDPSRPLHPHTLRSALHPYCPTTLDPAGEPRHLPGGGAVTVEPGGQVEISTPPSPSLAALHRDTEAGIAALCRRLSRAGLVLGGGGIDAHRSPAPVLRTPRYAAMARYFDRIGPSGRAMMCATAAVQVSVDAGEPHEVAARWRMLHAVGPPMVAAFATSRWYAGRDTGYASARMAAWLRADPARTAPVWHPHHDGGHPHHDRGHPARNGGDPHRDTGEPRAAWARYALAAPLLCLRRTGTRWDAPPGLTFAGWITGAPGAPPDPPTTDDLDYHLGTLFPPVRPRGYLEVRYLDAQPPGEWIAPAAVLVALLADPAVRDEAAALCAPVAGRWAAAARYGLDDPLVGAAARHLLDLACRNLRRTDLPAAVRRRVTDIVRRRLAAAGAGLPVGEGNRE